METGVKPENAIINNAFSHQSNFHDYTTTFNQ